jgi:hypothetical protein
MLRVPVDATTELYDLHRIKLALEVVHRLGVFTPKVDPVAVVVIQELDEALLLSPHDEVLIVELFALVFILVELIGLLVHRSPFLPFLVVAPWARDRVGEGAVPVSGGGRTRFTP